MNWLMEWRDADGTLRLRTEHQLDSAQWRYNRIGGCGDFTVALDRLFKDTGGINADWDLRVYRVLSASPELWYRGYVEEISQERRSDGGDRLSITGQGYSGQLDRILIDAEYTNTKVESIVGDIMLNQGVVSKTSITFSSANVTTTSVTATSLSFKNVTAGRAVNDLAELAGGREWGVDRQAAFFFHGRRDVDTLPSSADMRFVAEAEAKVLTLNDRFREIVNAVTVEAAIFGGSTIIVSAVSSASQVAYGRREARLSLATLASSSDAATTASNVISEKSSPTREVRFNVLRETMVESVALGPTGEVTPLVSIVSPTVKYGEKKYGTFRYSGIRRYSLTTATYNISRQGFGVVIDAGENPRTPSTFAARTVDELDAIRQRGIEIGELAPATAQATTSGSQVDFTGLHAGLNSITIIFDGVGVSAADHILIQLGDSGGIETSGYDSVSTLVEDAADKNTAVSSTLGLIIYLAQGVNINGGHMVLTRISGNTWVASHSVMNGSNAGVFGSGIKSLSAELDRIRITVSGVNTFDAGQVNLLLE